MGIKLTSIDSTRPALTNDGQLLLTVDEAFNLVDQILGFTPAPKNANRNRPCLWEYLTPGERYALNQLGQDNDRLKAGRR